MYHKSVHISKYCVAVKHTIPLKYCGLSPELTMTNIDKCANANANAIAIEVEVDVAANGDIRVNKTT